MEHICTQDELRSIGSLLLLTLDEFALNLHNPNQEVVDSENIGKTLASTSQFCLTPANMIRRKICKYPLHLPNIDMVVYTHSLNKGKKVCGSAWR